MNRASRLRQTGIYTRTCFRVFVNERGWKIFISAAIISGIICMVTGPDMFSGYGATRNGAFAIVCACIWIGIFNSIQSVCRERDIIKREHRSGLHISSYVVSHMIFEMSLCAVESIIVTLLICAAHLSNLPKTGVLFPTFMEFAVTFFIIIYSSDILGLMVSCIVKTTNTAMTVMPFILILQLVMSGMIFELKGVTKAISNLTIAKWSLNAICTIADVNTLTTEQTLIAKYAADYEHTVGHVAKMWIILIIFTLIYGAVGIIGLEFVDKDKR